VAQEQHSGFKNWKKRKRKDDKKSKTLPTVERGLDNKWHRRCLGKRGGMTEGLIEGIPRGS